MRRMFQFSAVSVLALVVVIPVAAQQPGPGQRYVKELLLHLPGWVQTTDGAWEGMRRTNEGWEPVGTALETSEPIFNHRTKRPYTRSIYEVTFKENPAPPAPPPPPPPPPRTYTAAVVFEDFGQNVQIPPPPRPSPKREWKSEMVPVLVTKGEEKIEQPAIRQSRWEYVKLN